MRLIVNAAITGTVVLRLATPAHADPSVEVYDPSSGVWTFAQSMTMPRSGHAAALGSDTRIDVTGGDQAGSVEAYTP
jgi:hypothetical protein